MAKAEERDERIAQTARLIEENRTGVMLTGHIRNGQVELDRATMDRIQKGYPGPDTAFIAVNAPFDAESRAI